MSTGPEWIDDFYKDDIVVSRASGSPYGYIPGGMFTLSLLGLSPEASELEAAEWVAQLDSLAGWAEEADALVNQGWEWITFGLDVSNVADQSATQALKPLQPGRKPPTTEHLEEQIAAAGGLSTQLIVSKPLYAPVENLDALVPHSLNDQIAETLTLPRGPFLSAGINTDERKLFLGMPNLGGEGKFIHYYHRYRWGLAGKESDISLEALSAETWELLSGLNARLHNEAVSRMASLLLKEDHEQLATG